MLSLQRHLKELCRSVTQCNSSTEYCKEKALEVHLKYVLHAVCSKYRLCFVFVCTVYVNSLSIIAIDENMVGLHIYRVGEFSI